MIDELIVHPTGVGSAKLRLHPASLDLQQNMMQVTYEVLNNDESVINRGTVIISGDDMIEYLKGDVTQITMFNLIRPRLNYTAL